MAEELPVTHHTEIFHTRHCTYNLHVHLVFVVKYRKKIFTAEILKDLKIIFETICLELDADLIEFDGEQDHVHLLILYPPKLAISDLVFRLKGVSSRLIRQRNYHSVTTELWGHLLWSPSYFAASCGGAPISIIRQYIENQNTPD